MGLRVRISSPSTRRPARSIRRGCRRQTTRSARWRSRPTARRCSSAASSTQSTGSRGSLVARARPRPRARSSNWTIPAGTIVRRRRRGQLLPIGNRLYGGFGRGPNYSAAFRLDNGDVGSQVWRFNTVGNDESMAMSNDGTRLFVGGHFGTARADQQTVCGNQPPARADVLNPVNGALYCDWLPAITPQGGNFTGAWAMVSTGTWLYASGLIDAINGVPHIGPRALPALTDEPAEPAHRRRRAGSPV